jgi:hypothetical protein
MDDSKLLFMHNTDMMTVHFDTHIPNSWVLFSLATVVGSFLLLRALRKPKTKYHYPPGPKGSPIFGNLFQLPPRYPGEKLLEWGKQYGDMSVAQTFFRLPLRATIRRAITKSQ